MKHIVKYTESERGYGGEVWYDSHTSHLSAVRAVEECLDKLPKNEVIPDYYVLAEYIGEWATVPVGYKF